jgi:hypothetical protein
MNERKAFGDKSKFAMVGGTCMMDVLGWTPTYMVYIWEGEYKSTYLVFSSPKWMNEWMMEV